MWSGSLGGEYTQSTLGGEILVQADANAKTKVFGDATDSAYAIIGGYTLVNASFRFRAAKGWELAVFARNLRNQNYLQNVTVQAASIGLMGGTPNEREPH